MIEALSTDVLETGTGIRILPSDIGPVIPVVDIADRLEYSRSAITKAIRGHEGKMSPCKTFLPLWTPGGEQQFLCLNRTGIDYLLLYIHPSKSRMSDDEFIDFRRGILEKMSGNEIQEPSINQELLQARGYAEACNQDPAAFQAAVFRKHNLNEFADIVRPAITHGETGWYNVTQLCEMCRDDALAGHPERLNAYLKNHGYQYREQGLWRLQPSGEIHGKEYWYEAPSGHREIRIRWQLSILYASGLLNEVG